MLKNIDGFITVVIENEEEWERDGDHSAIDNDDIAFGGMFSDMDSDPDDQTHW